MRISDWSSDVCSSDLGCGSVAGLPRASRALLGVDQRQLAEMAGVSLPTIQRMEASEGTVRGVVDSLMKVIEALDRAGVELIGDNMASSRTEERRVGKECVGTCKSRRSTYH